MLTYLLSPYRYGFWTGFDAGKKQRICKEQNFAQQDSVECAEDSTTHYSKKSERCSIPRLQKKLRDDCSIAVDGLIEYLSKN